MDTDLRLGRDEAMRPLAAWLLVACMVLGAFAGTAAADPPDFARLIPGTVPRGAIFAQPGWCLWDTSLVRGDEGEWVHDGRWYAVVKDHDAPFLTAHGRRLLLFESPDGRAWQPAAKPFLEDFAISREGGIREVSGGRESFLVLMPLNHPEIANVSCTRPHGEAKP